MKPDLPRARTMVHWWCTYCGIEHRVAHDVRIRREHGHAVIDLRHLRCPNPPPPNPMSANQTEAVRLVANGLLIKQAARQMGISYHTIKTHLKRAQEKTGTTRTRDLVNLALRQQWVRKSTGD